MVKHLRTNEDYDNARLEISDRHLLNELAIILTKKIESELMTAICRANGIMEEPKLKFAPNFFHIRKGILSVLTEYLDVLHVETRNFPINEEISDEIIAKIKEEQLKKEACILVQRIFERDDLFLKRAIDSDYERFILATKDIVVLKTGKLLGERP